MRLAGHILLHMKQIKDTCTILVRKPKGKIPLGRSMYMGGGGKYSECIQMSVYK